MSFLDTSEKVLFFRFFTKQNIGLAILAVLLLIFGLRGCSQKEVARKKSYTIGRDNTWYPHNLMGKERNLIAFTNDLFAVIAQESKLRFEWVETSSSRLVEGLDYNHYDAIVSSMRPNFVNRNTYTFSELFFELGPVLIVQQNSQASSLKDMQGKTVGISTGFYLYFNTIKEGGANAYNIHLVTYENMNRALDLLEKENLNGVIMNTIPAYTLTEGLYAGRLKVVTPPLTDEGLRLVALQGVESEELLKDFDNSLKTLKANGVYDQLINKWNLIDPEVKFMKNTKKQ